MTREQFDAFVRRVENGVGRRPAALRWRVACLAVAGYAGLLAWLIAVVLLATAFSAMVFFVDWAGKLICGFAGLAILFGGGWAVLRVLLVRLPPPEGRPTTRQEAPNLFALLDELRTQVRSHAFHRVLVIPVCNAAVVQVPRLGVLGWPHNYLLLGLPLLEGLSPAEIRAVLAHEFAHLSRQHGRFSRWIYRLRRSWEQVFEQLSRPRLQGEVSFRPIIVKYVDWFWPRFNAHAFVLSRADEYEADAMAARLAGSAQLASALVRLAVYERLLDDKFWPDLWQTANERAEPPNAVFLQLRHALRASAQAPDLPRWIDQAFRAPTTNADTHPCLSDRLRAMGLHDPQGASARLAATPAPLQSTAAEALLGSALDAIRSDVEQRWRNDAGPAWRERHQRAAVLAHRLGTLDRAVPNVAGDADSLWDKARVLLDLKGDQAAEPLLRDLLALRPDHAAANFHLGRILLQAGQAEGETLLERAIDEDDECIRAACGLLHEHYRRTGRADCLRALDARMDRYEKDLAASRAERNSVTAADPLIPHGLSDAELAALRQTLEAESELAVAELARKDLRHFPKQKLFLLCVRPKPPWHRLPSRVREQALVSRLVRAVRLPGRVLVFAPSGSFRALARKLARVPASLVYRIPR